MFIYCRICLFWRNEQSYKARQESCKTPCIVMVVTALRNQYPIRWKHKNNNTLTIYSTFHANRISFLHVNVTNKKWGNGPVVRIEERRESEGKREWVSECLRGAGQSLVCLMRMRERWKWIWAWLQPVVGSQLIALSRLPAVPTAIIWYFSCKVQQLWFILPTSRRVGQLERWNYR